MRRGYHYDKLRQSPYLSDVRPVYFVTGQKMKKRTEHVNLMTQARKSSEPTLRKETHNNDLGEGVQVKDEADNQMVGKLRMMEYLENRSYGTNVFKQLKSAKQ